MKKMAKLENFQDNSQSEKTFVTQSKIYEAIEALKKVGQKKSYESSKLPLFENEHNYVFLQIGLKKIPPNFSTFIHNVKLPHHWRHEINYETCLIVKDVEKEQLSDRDADIERSRDHYRKILNNHSASDLIGEILPMRQLKNEFRLPPLRKRLSNEYHAFLCDKKLLRNKHSFLNSFLGKAFWIDSKKVPIPINLESENLKNELNEKLDSTSIYISGKGSTITVRVGLLHQELSKLVKNLQVILEKIKQIHNENVRELALKTEKSMSIMFFVDLGSSQMISFPKFKGNTQKQFIEDEFDFLTNTNVRVFKDGRIRLLKRRKNESDQDEEEPGEMKLIKSINFKPDDENWNRRLVFNIPKKRKKKHT